MKRLIAATSVAVVLTGCGTFGAKSNAQAPIPSPTPAVTKDQTVAAQGKVDAPSTIDIPAWYIKAPASTEDYVYISGTGYSSDLSMSQSKAVLDAQVKLADKINGTVNALMKQYKTDNGGAMGTDKTSLTVKKLIVDTAVTGYHLEDSRVVNENRAYRSFVLIRYPMGDANRLLKDKLQRENQNGTSVDAALDELEQEINARKKPQARPKTNAEPQVKAGPNSNSTSNVQAVPDTNGAVESRSLTPAPAEDKQSRAPVRDIQLAQADFKTPLTLGEIQAIERENNLAEVSNMDLRRRRAEAMLKPGAYVQRFTLR
jgi:hypothetical protein